MGFCDSLSHKNIVDFPYGNHIVARILHRVQNGFAKGFHGIVMPVGRPHKFAFFLPSVGPGNHPSNLPFILHGQLPGNFTAPVELLESKGFFISADLQNGIC